MKKITILIAGWLTFLVSHAQTDMYTISGKVVDITTQQPLQSASVFAQNTTIGTTTDAAGNFSIKLPNGGYDLIVSYTGYDIESKRVTTADAGNAVTISIKQKDKTMEVVAIASSNEVKDGLEKYGNFFFENFIGKTANSSACTIKNPEVLKFYFSKRKNRLKVMASAPLEIVNLALGFKISYTIDSFTHEYATQVSTFSGYPLFEALPTTDSITALKWQRNRLKAYEGSIVHFMRSLYQKRIKEEGFEIQFVAKSKDTETAIPVLNVYGGMNYSMNDSTRWVEVIPNQTDVAVIYKKEKPEAGYDESGEITLKDYQLSFVTFPENQTIAIEQNGYYFDQNDLIITGYWSWEKVADMVPYDFVP
ncbi:MAG: carboxypeptidase-like regulatory domain-containing protein [Ferruginibacter sp.]